MNKGGKVGFAICYQVFWFAQPSLLGVFHMNNISSPGSELPQQLKRSHLKPTWFEKTIEYRFLLDYLDPDVVASPLDGNAETYWGDMIDGKNGEFRLIEFKVDQEALSSEKDKYLLDGEKTILHFTRYVAEVLKSNVFSMPGSRGHWLVYGRQRIDLLTQPASWKLDLLALPYSEVDAANSVTLRKETPLERVPASVLYEYMQALQAVRNRTGKSSGGGFVLATAGGTTRVHGQEEFIRIYEQRLEITRELTLRRQQSRSFGFSR